MPPQNVSSRHMDYFESKAIENIQMQQKLKNRTQVCLFKGNLQLNGKFLFVEIALPLYQGEESSLASLTSGKDRDLIMHNKPY